MDERFGSVVDGSKGLIEISGSLASMCCLVRVELSSKKQRFLDVISTKTLRELKRELIAKSQFI